MIVLRLCKLLALGVDEPEGGAGDSRLSDDFDGFIDKFSGASSCGSLTAAATAAAAAAAKDDAIDDEDFELRFKPAHSLICSDMESLPANKISVIREHQPKRTGTREHKPFPALYTPLDVMVGGNLITSIRSLLPPLPVELPPPDPIAPIPDRLLAPPPLLLLLPEEDMEPPDVAPCCAYSLDSIRARLFPRPPVPEDFGPAIELVYLIISVSGGNRTPSNEDGSLELKLRCY